MRRNLPRSRFIAGVLELALSNAFAPHVYKKYLGPFFLFYHFFALHGGGASMTTLLVAAYAERHCEKQHDLQVPKNISGVGVAPAKTCARAGWGRQSGLKRRPMCDASLQADWSVDRALVTTNSFDRKGSSNGRESKSVECIRPPPNAWSSARQHYVLRTRRGCVPTAPRSHSTVASLDHIPVLTLFSLRCEETAGAVFGKRWIQ